ncbi:protein of unknown function [Burkholderia multivorans]
MVRRHAGAAFARPGARGVRIADRELLTPWHAIRHLGGVPGAACARSGCACIYGSA